MSTFVRQPFAPLDGARLQSLISLKNRQNAISNSGPVKRKASEVDVDDFENLDPVFFSKRSKGLDNYFPSFDLKKPASFTLTTSKSTPEIPKGVDSPAKHAGNLPRSTSSSSLKAVTTERALLQPKGPTVRLNTKVHASPKTPAGRSPTRGAKLIGGINGSGHRRRSSRMDMPTTLGSAAPFSLDAALKGTIPSYGGDLDSPIVKSADPAVDNVFGTDSMPSSWEFTIHEDTPEQEKTNLLLHSTVILDISSDEETELRANLARAEGKENVPPVDDVSQTNRTRLYNRVGDADSMIVEKQRGPLIDLDPADYYPEGHDASSVIVIVGDENDPPNPSNGENDGPDTHQLPETVKDVPEDKQDIDTVTITSSAPRSNSTSDFDFAIPVNVLQERPIERERAPVNSIEQLMGGEGPSAKAAVLQPIEGTGEHFELWESNSAKDAASIPGSPCPGVENKCPPGWH